MSITKRRDAATVTPIIIPVLYAPLSLGLLDSLDVEEGLTVIVFVLSDWLVDIEPVNDSSSHSSCK